MGLLDGIFNNRVFRDGVEAVARKKLNFKGSVSVVDNPSSEATDVEITSSVVSKTVQNLISAVGSYDLQQVAATGYASHNDDGGGTFVWRAGSSATPDGGTVFQVGANPGRWHRVSDGPRVHAKWFGFAPENAGSTNKAALQYAATFLNSLGGGDLEIGKGTFEFAGAGGIILEDNIIVRGRGRGTIIKRTDTGGRILDFRGADTLGTSGSGVEDVHFQVSAYENFITMVDAQNCDGFFANRCRFELVGAALSSTTSNDTQHAILGRNNRRFRITNCDFIHTQAKLGGLTYASDILVQGCYFYHSHNYGISVVARSTGSDERIERVQILGNEFDTAGGGGSIYVGTDNDGSDILYVGDVLIADNIVRKNTTEANHTSILVRMAQTTENVIIRDNVLVNEAGSPGASSFGISVKAGVSTMSFSDVAIFGNKVEGADLYGIAVFGGSGAGLTIADNKVRDCRGIYVECGHANGISNVNIHDNQCRSVVNQGLWILADGGPITGLLIHHEQTDTVTGSTTCGIRIDGDEIIKGTIDHCYAKGCSFGLRAETGLNAATRISLLDNNYADVNTTGFSNLATAGQFLGSGNRGAGTHGFVTQKRGRATVANGGTSVTVTHGLIGVDTSALATTGQFQATLMKPNSGAASLELAIDTIGATQFVARLSAATAEAGYEVHWSATAAEYV